MPGFSLLHILGKITENTKTARERENDERRERRSLTLCYTRGLGKVVFHVMVPQPMLFLFGF
jgi:hypothetical protein